MLNLIGRSNLYELKKNEGKIPNALKKYKHTLKWPINLENQIIHLSCYFKELNYSGDKKEQEKNRILSPRNFLYELHKGIDIQLPQNEEIFAPEDSIILHYKQDDLRNGLADIYLYGMETKILYNLAHLNANNFANILKSETEFNPDSKLIIYKDSLISTIGNWPFNLDDFVEIPEDVRSIFGTKYNHLHLEMHDYNHQTPKYGFFLNDYQFNPLLLLKDLNE